MDTNIYSGNSGEKYSQIKKRLKEINDQIRQAALGCGRDPEEITLIAVSKKKSVEAIIQAINDGVKTLGENYIQEAVDKIELIAKQTTSLKIDEALKPDNTKQQDSVVIKKEKADVDWHFIGHLQSNKAKVAVKYFDLIHTVDTLKLAQEINRHAEKEGKIQNILIQVNISQEETKSGTTAADAIELAKAVSHLKNISLRGVMGMPPFFDDPERARPYLRKLAQVRDAIKRENISGIYMDHLSMGMSDDFKVAIEEGSTMVRIGTAIFGSRA